MALWLSLGLLLPLAPLPRAVSAATPTTTVPAAGAASRTRTATAAMPTLMGAPAATASPTSTPAVPPATGAIPSATPATPTTGPSASPTAAAGTATASVPLSVATVTTTATTGPAAPLRADERPELDQAGGKLDFPDGLELTVPAGALAGKARVRASRVETRFSQGLLRHNPLGQAVRIEAEQANGGGKLNKLQRKGTTVRFDLDRPEVPDVRLANPGIRMLTDKGWVKAQADWDKRAKKLRLELDELPVTLAVVDESRPERDGAWDPNDPSAVQFASGTWGVAYLDLTTNPSRIAFRRTFDDASTPFWTDPVTVEEGADGPAALRLGSSLAVFYAKPSVPTARSS